MSRAQRVYPGTDPRHLDLHLICDNLPRPKHRGVAELEAGIRQWINEWNRDPKPIAGPRPRLRSWAPSPSTASE
jgi:hypothetical protein